MARFVLPIAEIAELGTQVATAGAIHAAEISSDQVFEAVIAVAVLIYELAPQV